MQATDVMTRDVITVSPETEVREIVELLIQHRISALPVVTADQRVVGIVSEGDLMRRVENKTDKRDSWWLSALFSGSNDAERYIRSHGHKAADIMSRDPVTISDETPLYKIAQTLEKHHIKRVPVVKDGKLVGIVSRANLLQGFAVAYQDDTASGSDDDQTLREKVMQELTRKAGLSGGHINVVVAEGEVQLWGLVETATEQKAAGLAAESVKGVKRVVNNLGVAPPATRAY
jgi:CBS-domain-containing membrane protein